MPIQPREELIWLPRTLDPDDPNVEVCAQFQFLITMITTMVALLGQICHDLQGQRSMPVLDVQFSPIHDAIPAQQCGGQKRMWFSIFFRFAWLQCMLVSLFFPTIWRWQQRWHSQWWRACVGVDNNAGTTSSEQWAVMRLLFVLSHNLS